jgi:Domain of unknown function (DUF4190)
VSDEASEAPADPPPWQPPLYPPPPVYAPAPVYAPPPGYPQLSDSVAAPDAPPPPPYAAPPGWQPPAAPYGAQPPPYGAPPPPAAPTGWHSVGGYPQPSPYPQPGAYPQPGGYPPAGAAPPYGVPPPYGYAQPRSTNGFAIASICCSISGIVLWVVGPLLGLTFGILSLRATADGRQRGRGWAIAGIVVGVLMLLIDVLAIIGAVHGNSTHHNDNGGFNTGLNT